MTETRQSSIVIIDDHPAVRDGLSLRIEREPGLAVIGEAADPGAAEALIRATPPDVAVIDLMLKGGSGLELIKQIRSFNESVRILVWSVHRETHYAKRALSAGAQGYINKQAMTDEVIDAIRRVVAGETYLSPAVAAAIAGGSKRADTDSIGDVLSDRELETFNNIGNGLTTEQIAERMNLSPKTIETYRARIKMKLGLTNMAELSRAATQWVLESSPPA